MWYRRSPVRASYSTTRNSTLGSAQLFATAIVALSGEIAMSLVAQDTLSGPMSNGAPRRTLSHPFAMHGVRASEAESSNAKIFASMYLLRTSPPLVRIAAIAARRSGRPQGCLGPGVNRRQLACDSNFESPGPKAREGRAVVSRCLW